MHKQGGKPKTIPLSNTTKETLNPIITSDIMSSRTIYTDDNPSYTGAYRQHKVVNHSAMQHVNEFGFRLSDRNYERDAQDRLNSLLSKMTGERITYKEVIRC